MFDVAGLFVLACLYFTISWMSAVQAARYTRIGETWDAMFFEIYVWPTRWFVTVATALAGIIAVVQPSRTCASS